MVSQSKSRENSPDVTRFMSAVRRSDAAAVREMLKANPEHVAAHDYDSFGATALIHAANRYDRGMVDLLLEHGADMHQRSDWWAGSFGVLPNDDPDMTAFLIERGAHVDAHTAARMGWTDRLRQMIADDPDCVHSRAGDGQFPLHYADSAEVVDLLLEHGADLHGRDIDHESTAAQWQCSRNPGVCRHLIRRGAETDAFMAAAIGDLDLLENRLNRESGLLNARITAERFPTSDNTEALHIYAYTLGHDATLLHVACSRRQPDVIRFLLDRGMDPNVTGAYDQCTPLHLAAWEGQLDLVELLLSRGAAIDRKSGTIHGNEPIGWAIVAGRVDVVEYLVKRGAALHLYHLKDAQSGARGDYNYTNVPTAAFERVVDLLEQHLDDHSS